MFDEIAKIVDRLSAAGYTDDFRAVPGGLIGSQDHQIHTPESLVVDEVHRFEGTTDPGEEAILFALRCPGHGTRGTYTAPFGTDTPPADAEMIDRLQRPKQQ